MVVTLLLVSPACRAQSGAIEASARKEIDAGNQAWIDGMKQGMAAPIAATYTEGAVDCGQRATVFGGVQRSSSH
jgi:hypothetical protein